MTNMMNFNRLKKLNWCLSILEKHSHLIEFIKPLKYTLSIGHNTNQNEDSVVIYPYIAKDNMSTKIAKQILELPYFRLGLNEKGQLFVSVTQKEKKDNFIIDNVTEMALFILAQIEMTVLENSVQENI